MRTASDQITEYLSAGGLFNPEMMNQYQHEAVRDTLIKARDDIQSLERENVKLREKFMFAESEIILLREDREELRELAARMAKEMRETDHEFCSLVDYDNLKNKI